MPPLLKPIRGLLWKLYNIKKHLSFKDINILKEYKPVAKFSSASCNSDLTQLELQHDARQIQRKETSLWVSNKNIFTDLCCHRDINKFYPHSRLNKKRLVVIRLLSLIVSLSATIVVLFFFIKYWLSQSYISPELDYNYSIMEGGGGGGGRMDPSMENRSLTINL